MRLTLILIYLLATLSLVGCTSISEDDALSTMAPEIPAPAQPSSQQPRTTSMADPAAELVPAQILEPGATAMLTSTPTLTPASEPTSMPTANPGPALVPASLSTPSQTPPIPVNTAGRKPVQVALSSSLDGAPRADSPLFSYENQEVYSQVRALVSGQNDFVADFYRHLAHKSDGNLFYSPYSLYTAMAVLYAGADDDTAAEFKEVMGIGIPSNQFHRNLNSLDLTLMNDSVTPGQEGSAEAGFRPTLSVANGLWIQDGLEVLPGFLNTVTANYGIGLRQLDFRKFPGAAVEAINQWVDEATQGKIKQAINRESITEFTSLIVTNAVYFKGDWEDQFKEKNTTDQPFYLLKRKVVQVPMMYQASNYAFRLGDGYQAVELPYTSGFSMLVVMPDEGAFEIFEESLNGERLKEITDNLGSGKVILRIPRFKLVPFPLEYALYRIFVSPVSHSRASRNPELEAAFQYQQI